MHSLSNRAVIPRSLRYSCVLYASRAFIVQSRACEVERVQVTSTRSQVRAINIFSVCKLILVSHALVSSKCFNQASEDEVKGATLRMQQAIHCPIARLGGRKTWSNLNKIKVRAINIFSVYFTCNISFIAYFTMICHSLHTSLVICHSLHTSLAICHSLHTSIVISHSLHTSLVVCHFIAYFTCSMSFTAYLTYVRISQWIWYVIHDER